MKLGDRAERMASALFATLRRPAVQAILFCAIAILGLTVRIARVNAADDVLSGHIDGKQYFADAYSLHLKGFFEPFPHRANGWPLLLALALKVFGFYGTSGFTIRMDAPYDQEAADAIFFAYAFHAAIAATLVIATILLARQLVGPLTAAAAGLFVALDPFLLGQSTSVMADQVFAVLVVLALYCVCRARSHAAWLVPAGALIALSHMARVNGLVMLGTLVLFAAIYLRSTSSRHRLWHLAIPILAFALVAAPYLAWRAHYLPHAFDYGTNQRFWADDLWNMSDAYWQSYSYANGGVRETAADYFSSHTAGQALERAYQSAQWPLIDLTQEVLSPMLLVLGVVGIFATRRKEWALMTPLVALTLFAGFFWIYPVVRSPRYFLVLIPLFAILAAAGVTHAAAATRRASVVACSIAALFVAWHGVEPIAAAPEAVVVLRDAHAAPMVLAFAVAMVVVATTAATLPGVLDAARRARVARWAKGET